MKKVIVMMALIISSVSGHARSMSAKITAAPFILTIGSIYGTGMISSGWSLSKEARQIIADGEEYALTGQMAPYLKESVEILQAQSEDLSTEQAVDLLMEKAISILE